MYVFSSDGTVYKVSLRAGGKEGQVSCVSPLPCGSLMEARVVKYDSAKLLVTGGESMDHNWEARTWSLDLGSGSWSQGPSLTTGRCRHTSFQLGNQLYVCGGRGEGGNWLSSIEALGLTDAHPRWTPLTEQPPETVNIEFPALSHVNIVKSHVSVLHITGIHLQHVLYLCIKSLFVLKCVYKVKKHCHCLNLILK